MSQPPSKTMKIETQCSMPKTSRSQQDQAQTGQAPSEQSSDGSQPSEGFLLQHARDVFEAKVTMYNPSTLDLLPEQLVVEHYLLLSNTI